VSKILVIDDDQAVRSYLRDVLESAGHQVSEAADGEAGLKLALGEGTDLVLCDLYMPVREGLETIREMRRLRPSVPVLAMSGGSRDLPDFLALARAMGAADALRKPIGPAGLLRAVSGHLPAPG
jgi:CheY-like chemotaxis protein